MVEEAVLSPRTGQTEDQQSITDGAPIFREVEPRAPVVAPETEVAATADETPVIEQPAAGGAGEAVTDLAAAGSTVTEDAAELPLAATILAASAASEAADQPLQLEEANLSASTAMAHNRDPESEMVITAIGTSWIELSRPMAAKLPPGSCVRVKFTPFQVMKMCISPQAMLAVSALLLVMVRR